MTKPSRPRRRDAAQGPLAAARREQVLALIGRHGATLVDLIDDARRLGSTRGQVEGAVDDLVQAGQVVVEVADGRVMVRPVQVLS